MAETIKGLASLKRKLSRLPKAAEIAIKDAMAQGADEIVAMMKSLVPVDTGDLRDSIAWTWGKAPKRALALASVSSNDGKLTLTIYASDYKARWVEFGVRPHDIFGRIRGADGQRKSLGPRGQFGPHVKHPGTSAHPYFFVSYRALRKRTKSRITRAVNKSAKQVAASG